MALNCIVPVSYMWKYCTSLWINDASGDKGPWGISVLLLSSTIQISWISAFIQNVTNFSLQNLAHVMIFALPWQVQKFVMIGLVKILLHLNTIVLFHNSFCPSSEQPKQHILAYKSEQSTASCIAIFHKYCCYIKHGGIITNLTLWNPWGVSKYHNAGMWCMD